MVRVGHQLAPQPRRCGIRALTASPWAARMRSPFRLQSKPSVNWLKRKGRLAWMPCLLLPFTMPKPVYQSLRVWRLIGEKTPIRFKGRLETPTCLQAHGSRSGRSLAPHRAPWPRRLLHRRDRRRHGRDSTGSWWHPPDRRFLSRRLRPDHACLSPLQRSRSR